MLTSYIFDKVPELILLFKKLLFFLVDRSDQRLYQRAVMFEGYYAIKEEELPEYFDFLRELEDEGMLDYIIYDECYKMIKYLLTKEKFKKTPSFLLVRYASSRIRRKVAMEFFAEKRRKELFDQDTDPDTIGTNIDFFEFNAYFNAQGRYEVGQYVLFLLSKGYQPKEIASLLSMHRPQFIKQAARVAYENHC
jgi:hypothetical protein